MSNVSHLYLVVFRGRDFFKIGKANNPQARIKDLEGVWGEVDYGASYYLAGPKNFIFKVESALHSLLEIYSVEVHKGDGETELFAVSALDIALQHLNILCSSDSRVSQVKIGIPPPLSPSSSFRRSFPHAGLVRRARALNRTAMDTAKKFARINRLLIMLLRREACIAYQYDMVDGCICFRIVLPDRSSSSWLDRVARYFDFFVDGFARSPNTGRCSVCIVNEVLQFKVHIETSNELVRAYWLQSEVLLNKLPRRSSAAKSPIPLLDESEIRTNFEELMLPEVV